MSENLTKPELQETPPIQPVNTQNASIFSWWAAKKKPSSHNKELAAERIKQHPITREKDVDERLSLLPELTEVHEMLAVDGYIDQVQRASNEPFTKFPYETCHYALSINKGRIHPKIHGIYIPDELWIFREDGTWLNPLTPCRIYLDNAEARQLFDLEDIKYDILAIPVDENWRFANYGEEWLHSRFIVMGLDWDQVDALFCIARVPLGEAKELMALLNAKEKVRGNHCFKDGEQAIVTWIRCWPKPSIDRYCGYARYSEFHYRGTYSEACDEREQQIECLLPGSYTEQYNAIKEQWHKEATLCEEQRAREAALRVREAYLAQLEDSRKLFADEGIYNMAEMAGYHIDLTGEKAVLYRENVKLYAKRRPRRIRTFRREFPIDPDGLTMVKNFLQLRHCIEGIDDYKLRRLKKDGITIWL